MLHEPVVELGKDHSIPQKTKLGIIMFLAYLIIYAGFVFIGTIFPKALGAKVIGDQNLAFVYGMGLILLAAVMGLIYNYFCTKFENKWNKGT